MKRPLLGILLLTLAFAGGLALRWIVMPKPLRPVAPGQAKSAIAEPTPTPSSAPSVPIGPNLPPAPTASAFKVVKGQKGFWRIVQLPDGTWWFLNPQDQLQVLLAVAGVQPNTEPPDLS